MTKKEAMKILVENSTAVCSDDWKTIIVHHEDIRENIRCNDYELNLEWFQDFSTTGGDIVANIALEDLEVIQE